MTKLINITGKALSGEWGTDDELGCGIPILRTTNFTNEGVVNYSNVVTRTITKKNINEKFLRKGDIIIEKSGGSDKFPVGRVIYFDGDDNKYLFNNFTGLLRVKDQNEWYPKYVFYSLFANYKRGGTRAFENKTTGLHNLKIDDYVSTYEISNADLDEQKTICNKLDKLFGIIKSREKELRLLDDLIKARFVEMFGNKGENPNGYEEDKLGNLYKFQYGKGNNIPEDKGEYPCYGSNGIVGHHTEYNNEDSPIIGHIGAYAGIVNWGVGKHYVTYNGVMCKLKTDSVNPIYGFHLLQQQDFNRVATKGGGQPFVSYGDLEAPIVVVPPIEVQEAYAAFAEQTDKSKFKPVFL